MNTKYCTRIIYGCSTKCNKFLKHNSEIMPLSAEHGDELLLALNADGLAYLFAVPESDQRGDAEHAEALSDVRVIVHIELADLDLAAYLLLELIEDRALHTAGAAPLRPEINDNKA